MASFDFTAADGTTLQTLDAKWNEDVPGDTRVKNNQARTFVGSHRYVLRRAWYANSQPDLQSSQIVLVGETTPEATAFRYLYVQMNGARDGYRLQIFGGYCQLNKNGSYLTDNSPNANDFTTSTTWKLAIEDAGGGSVYIRAYRNGVQVLSYTDASPLTGGYPGFGFYPDGDLANTDPVGWDDWTDGIAAVNTPALSTVDYTQFPKPLIADRALGNS